MRVFKINKDILLIHLMGNCATIIQENREFNQLVRTNPKDVDLFSLNSKEFICRIVSVYDGDTCTAMFKLNQKMVKFKIRMLGYDSPEMRPRINTPNRDEIIEKAKSAKEALLSKVQNKKVILKCGKWDKYGRLLGTLYVNNQNINEWMLSAGHGYPYFGGKKRLVNEV